MVDCTPLPEHSTFMTFGMRLPVIAELGDGWYLVAHPNGAAIATKHTLTILGAASKESLVPPEDPDDALYYEEDTTAPPEEIRAKAVEAFERLAWPLVRGHYWQDSAPTPHGLPDVASERLLHVIQTLQSETGERLLLTVGPGDLIETLQSIRAQIEKERTDARAITEAE